MIRRRVRVGPILSMKRAIDSRYDWPTVIAVYAALGIWEGLRPVPAGGDVWWMWAALAAVTLLHLFGQMGWRHALAFLPLAIAVQDAFSTFAQGVAPVNQVWYCNRFTFLPDALCWTDLGIPFWWVLAFGITVVGDRIADHYVDRMNFRRMLGKRGYAS